MTEVEQILRRLDAMDSANAARFDSLEAGQKRTWGILADSTTEGGSVVDRLRKSEAQIRDMRATSWGAFCARHAVATLISIGIAGAVAFIGRSFIASLAAEVLKVSAR